MLLRLRGKLLGVSIRGTSMVSVVSSRSSWSTVQPLGVPSPAHSNSPRSTVSATVHVMLPVAWVSRMGGEIRMSVRRKWRLGRRRNGLSWYALMLNF